MSADKPDKPRQDSASPEQTLDGIRDAMRKLDTARKALLEERDEKTATADRTGAAARRRRVRARTL